MQRSYLLILITGLAFTVVARPQSEAAAVTLEIDVQNLVIYRNDVFDATRLAASPGPTTPLPIRNFMQVTWIADVVAVNGSPVKGAAVGYGTFISLNTAATPGVGIGDTVNSFPSHWTFDIQRADGSPIGSIMAGGWTLGSRSAGTPGPGQGNLAVLGGTGLYLGLRGEGKMNNTAGRFASNIEDPANRRALGGGGTARFTLQVVPLVRPTISGVFHEDFSPVTAASPARRGETLIAAAAGLGPTLPGKAPGEPFAADNLQVVAAPVQVLLNDAPFDTVNQVGWPGATGSYRADFRVPEATPAGMVRLQLIAGWIPGPEVRIPVQ